MNMKSLKEKHKNSKLSLLTKNTSCSDSVAKRMPRKHSTENQQAMSILRAGKLEHGYEDQKLVSSLKRGSLWNITKYTQSIFLKTGCLVRQLASVNSFAKSGFCWHNA